MKILIDIIIERSMSEHNKNDDIYSHCNNATKVVKNYTI